MPDEDKKREVSDRVWRAAAVAILIAGALLRLYDLDLVPLHHDEGVNGGFVKILVREGVYEYDPENYHGPTLFYLSAVIPWVSKLLFGSVAGDRYGLTTFNIRLVTAIFGIATVGLILLLRRRLGTITVLTAATALAVSPGAVYLSRYFIHESLLVFFTLAAVIAAMKFYETAKPGYVLLLATLAGLTFATKETAIITAGVLLIAWAITFVTRFRESRKTEDPEVSESEKTGSPRSIIVRGGGPSGTAILAIAGLSVFVAVNIVLYSSFFTNYPKGVYDAVIHLCLLEQNGNAGSSAPLVHLPDLDVAQRDCCFVTWRRGSLPGSMAPKGPVRSFHGLVGHWTDSRLLSHSIQDALAHAELRAAARPERRLPCARALYEGKP